MSKTFLLSAFSVCVVIGLAASQETPSKGKHPQREKPNYQESFFRKAINGSVFIYGPQTHPCTPMPKGRILLPRGSGFVVGIAKRGASSPEKWVGWRFLITAKHVLANQDAIIVRVNTTSGARFVCKKIPLQGRGKGQDLILAPPGVDLEAVALPQIEGADPTVITTSLLLDKEKMKDWNIGVGTQVLTIGYLFAYSGQKANFPVAKFGHISLITDELWYTNPESKQMEQAYVLDLPNAPGLSGAPVFTYGFEFETNPFRYRELPPYVVGVVKGLMIAPVGGHLISQGVAIVEPSSNLEALVRRIAEILKSEGNPVANVN